MGLFNDLGKTVERTKRAYLGGRTPAFHCRSCETSVRENYEHCPHCGEPTVEPVETNDTSTEQ